MTAREMLAFAAGEAAAENGFRLANNPYMGIPSLERAWRLGYETRLDAFNYHLLNGEDEGVIVDAFA